MPTLTSAQGTLNAQATPNDTISITVNSGAYSLEYPPGTLLANASTTSATYTVGAGTYRLQTTGSVTYTVTANPDSGNAAVSYDTSSGVLYANGSPVSGAGPDGGITLGNTTFYPIADMTFASMLALSPATYQGRVVRVTDVNRALFESNGTRWKPVNGRAVIGTLDTDWTGVTGTAEQIAYQRTIPAGLIRNGDALLITGGFGKSGTSETTTIQLRLGAAGTTADTSILTTSPLATTNITHGMYLEFRRQSATSIQRGMNGATQNPFGASASARGSATTLASSLDSVNQTLTLTMTQSSTAEVPSAWGFRVELISSGA